MKLRENAYTSSVFFGSIVNVALLTNVNVLMLKE